MSKLLKFYGDGIKGRNHLYKFYCNNLDDAKKALIRFKAKGIKIAAAWFNDERIQ